MLNCSQSNILKPRHYYNPKLYLNEISILFPPNIYTHSMRGSVVELLVLAMIENQGYGAMGLCGYETKQRLCLLYNRFWKKSEGGGDVVVDNYLENKGKIYVGEISRP